MRTFKTFGVRMKSVVFVKPTEPFNVKVKTETRFRVETEPPAISHIVSSNHTVCDSVLIHE